MRKIEKSALLSRMSAELAAIILIGILPISVFATGKTEVSGKVYEFGEDSHYEYSSAETSAVTESGNTYGTFSIGGNVVATDSRDGVPAYEVSEGSLGLYYNYTDTLLNAGLDDWHLIEDKSKKVDTMTLDSDILKGAIILQTSKDRKNWVDADTITNAFSETPIRTSSIYTTKDVELINGCFYRVIVAYELRIRIEDSNFLFINTDKFDYKKCVEVYEFYAYTNSGANEAPDPNQTHRLGDKVRVKNFDSYSGEETIDKDDVHYGWDLGDFFVSGYTDKVTNSDGDMVFLKNVGDKVTLWFKLNENIDGLDDNENLTITADTEGYDQYFETPKMNFRRGVLIIRYTDHNNVKGEPTIYTNYLEANATVGADTKVQLFEEGDYEIALDYEITNDQLIDAVGHYRIFFKFSVRNGNCMVYPFDVVTGRELTNSSMTENGFRLDLAKSRYLKVNVKREVLKDSADGLVEDTRFNGPAKDGAEYTDEGIYTITVQNEYTGQFTVKKIYVGTNNILRAYMTTGLSIPEINDLIAQGATISDDGTIQLANITPSTEAIGEAVAPTDEPLASETDATVPSATTPDEPANAVRDGNILPIVGAIAVIIVGILVFAAIRKERNKKPQLSAGAELEGADEV